MSDQTNASSNDYQEQPVRTCIDRVLPIELSILSREVAIKENRANYTPQTRAAIEHAKRWEPGRTLGIYFMDGDPVVQEKVSQVYPEWSKHANIKFEVTNNPRAEIRISFQEQGSWSYIGTDALLIPRDKPTMNYGWLGRDTDPTEYQRVVLHEFGHALGLIHEHQNPATTIPWDKEAVYQYYSGPPNYWSREQTDRNLFLTYDRDKTQFSRFDKDSIMLYPVEQRFTIGDFSVGWNKQLSQLDKEFIGQQYPPENKPENQIEVGGEAVSGAIGEFNEVDIYTFVVDGAGRFTIETHGKTDVALSLFGPDDDTRFIAEDDDSGRRLNAKLNVVLRSGLYTIQVRHFSQERSGEYSISVARDT